METKKSGKNQTQKGYLSVISKKADGSLIIKLGTVLN